MMNRSNSTDPYVPPMMSFASIDPSTQKQYHLWDWDSTTITNSTPTPMPTTTTATFATTHNYNYPFIHNSPFPDFQPPLFPMATFPAYYNQPTTTTPVPDYPIGVVKSEEDGMGIGTSGNRIGLNLGHRTYFSTGDALAIDRLFARSRGVYALAHQPPRCQAEGCKADLSGAKHYHRRHKVCEFHSKSTVVIAGGLQQRFCQQCSRFHVLSEFDEAKRSCRKRLADHNRRRRKPQSSSTDSSNSKNTSTSTSNTKNHKSKQTTKNSRDMTTNNVTIASTATMSNGNTSMEVQQGYQNTGTHLRNGPPDLSLGGVAAVEDMEIGSQSLYHHHLQQQQQQRQQAQFSSQSSSSNTYFHHQNLFCSSSNEASQSAGGGSEQTGHHHHQSSLLHLGQAIFEVDFM